MICFVCQACCMCDRYTANTSFLEQTRIAASDSRPSRAGRGGAGREERPARTLSLRRIEGPTNGLLHACSRSAKGGSRGVVLGDVPRQLERLPVVERGMK